MTGAEWHLLRPWWLLLLLPAAWLLWRLMRHRGGPGAWRDVVDPGLLRHLLVEAGARRSRLPYLLLGIAWLVLVVALAGPTWRQLPQPVYQSPVYRVVVLDLSLSMNIADVKPSRLAQARFRAIDLIDQVEDGQVAMIAYGGEPYIVSPLTGDGATITAQVPLLSTDLLPTTGPPRADLALQMAGDLLAQAAATRADIILVTDSVSEPDRAEAAARALREAGHRVSVLAIGTEAGAPIPMPGGGFARNARGEVIVEGITLPVMAAVARAGGGEAVLATATGSELAQLAPREPGMTGGDALDGGIATDRWHEEGPWLVLLLLPLAALAFRRGWLGPPLLLLPVLLLPPSDAYALTWDQLWLRDDQRGYHALQQGRADEAAALFEDPDWRAAATYRDGDYTATLDALAGGDGATTAYNRGNALARLGRLEDAIAAYDTALAQAPDDADARFNRDLLQALLDSRQQDQEEGQQQKQQGDEPSQENGEAGDEEAPSDGDSSDESQAAQDEQQAGEPNGDGEQSGDGQAQAEGDDSGSDGDDAGDESGSPGESTGDGEDSTSDGSRGAEASAPGDDAGEDLRGQGGDTADAGTTAGDRSTGEGNAGREPTAEDLTTGIADREDGDGGEQAGGDTPAGGQAPGQDDLTGGPVEAADEQGEEAPGPGGGQITANESEQAIEQMLRRVEDDPGGLLRQRFMLQHLRRHGQLPE
jgi:Ca-activated chloride channel homolog